MKKTTSLIWFDQDLRLSDNPALYNCLQNADEYHQVLAVYILDEINSENNPLGGASRWWLHHSLTALNGSLKGKLNIYRGNAQDIILSLCKRFSVEHIHWNRRYEPWRITRDSQIKQQLKQLSINTYSYNGRLLNEPWNILKKDRSPYKIFTPYYRASQAIEQYSPPLPTPNININWQNDSQSLTVEKLNLLPQIAWDSNFYDCWQPGESGANQRLKLFLTEGLANYKQGRDFPFQQSVSRLSAHLHFGEISPREIHQQLRYIEVSDNTEHFKRELAWREFSYYLLFHWPNLSHKNLKEPFDQFPWQNDQQLLKCWQQGLTGYPIVDAGMRELRLTGYMHNRVRMITASFLVKNLLIDWRHGARWFWDNLVDADLANNSASWQWVAGCGTDAAPYFRIFNPVTQGEKFDTNGAYTKQYVPELRNLPNKYLFKPWEAPTHILEAANIELGNDYPVPIVEIKASRQAALAAYSTIKK